MGFSCFLLIAEVVVCVRKKRIAELASKARKARFGSVLPITGADFIREVSQAPSDVWVVVHLYKDGLVLMRRILFISKSFMSKI